ncbi:MAG: imidazole glycerol phosphate synthase subunit HisH [Lachnospiraceae bacterium]|nr:imidazole glycerol phosphate synthase subunit HisH [Lachnospiraceae bacterium]
MTAIIDYGLGNLFSIANMLRCMGEEAIITSERTAIEDADRMILPGVGKFDVGMENLETTGLKGIIQEQATAGKPVLGICLGMQLLGISSEEGKKKGLGLIEFETVRFCFGKEQSLKIPHMGWEPVKFEQSDCPLTRDLDDKQRYYFVHSYHAVCHNADTNIISCSYGYQFAAGVRNKNIYGVQFHPEKSHRYGMMLLQNFVRYC